MYLTLILSSSPFIRFFRITVLYTFLPSSIRCTWAVGRQSLCPDCCFWSSNKVKHLGVMTY
jgi:hypothetical protein